MDEAGGIYHGILRIKVLLDILNKSSEWMFILVITDLCRLYMSKGIGNALVCRL